MARANVRNGLRLAAGLSLLLAGILLCTATPRAGEIDTDAIARYELSLFGYSLGMTHDEATDIRPFDYLKQSDHSDSPYDYFGMIDQVVIEEMGMSLHVSFEGERVDRIVGRFQPVDMAVLLSQFRAAFGSGKDLSRTIEQPTGVLIKHDTYAWDFPRAKVILFTTNANNQYGTASLIRRSAKQPAKTGE